MASIDWTSAIKAVLRNTPDQGTGSSIALEAWGGLIASLGAACQGAVEKELGRTLRPVTYTDFLDGHGKRILYPPHDPIISVTSITVDGSAVTVGLPTATPRPACRISTDKRALEMINGGLWGCGFANITLVYNAGFQSFETESLESAIAQWGAALFRQRDILHLSSSSFGDGSTTAFRHVPPDFVERAYRGMRRVQIP